MSNNKQSGWDVGAMSKFGEGFFKLFLSFGKASKECIDCVSGRDDTGHTNPNSFT